MGEVARDVLGRVASQCEVWILRHHLLKEYLPEIYPKWEPWVDPWWPRPPKPEPDPIPWVYGDMLSDAVLGASMYAIGVHLGDPGPEAAAKLQEIDDLGEFLRPAAEHALREVTTAMERAGKRFETLRTTGR